MGLSAMSAIRVLRSVRELFFAGTMIDWLYRRPRLSNKQSLSERLACRTPVNFLSSNHLEYQKRF